MALRREPTVGGRERRAAARLDKVFPVIVSGPRGITFGVARSISRAGMFVEAAESQPVGSLVTVTFTIPGSPTEMAVEAEVRHASTVRYRARPNGLPASSKGMGLRFTRFVDDEGMTLGTVCVEEDDEGACLH